MRYFASKPAGRLKPGASHLSGRGHINLVTRLGSLDRLCTIGDGLSYEDLLPDSEELDLGNGASRPGAEVGEVDRTEAGVGGREGCSDATAAAKDSGRETAGAGLRCKGFVADGIFKQSEESPTIPLCFPLRYMRGGRKAGCPTTRNASDPLNPKVSALRCKWSLSRILPDFPFRGD